MANVSDLLRPLLLLIQPVEIVLLYCDHTPTDLLQSVTQDLVASAPVATVQIFNYTKYGIFRSQWSIDARHRTLLVTFSEMADYEHFSLHYLVDFIDRQLPDYYAYNFLFLVKWSPDAEELLTETDSHIGQSSAFRTVW